MIRETLYLHEIPAEDVRETPPLWGTRRSATGYGRKIPTERMIRRNGRWRRVYCCIFSNAGTCYLANRDGSWTVIA